jgi:hypothetical protein
MRKALFGALLHSISWFTADFLATYSFSDSPSRLAYGLLCSWWAALYVGFVGRITLASLPLAFMIYAVVMCVYGVFKFDLIHSKFLSQDSASLAIWLLLGALVFITPIVVNYVVQTVLRRFGFNRVA